MGGEGVTVPADAVLTPTRAARVLGMTPQGVADHIKRGNLDTVTVGGVRFVTAASLARLDKRRKAIARAKSPLPHGRAK